MTSHDHVEPLLAAHALGTIEAGERALVEAHLAECAACRATFEELCTAVTGLERSVMAASQPRAGARESLVERARRTSQVEATTAERAPARVRDPRHRPWRRWMPVAVPTLASVALLATAWNQAGRIDSLERRLDEARGDQVPVLKGASIDDLDIGGAFGDTDAQVVLARDAGIITFRDVPAPPDGMAWQVAAVDDDARIRSIGTITDARELAIVALEGIDADDIERIIVTTEPYDAAAEPDPVAEHDVAAEATV